MQDDAALLRSIPAIESRLGKMRREDLLTVWQHAVEAQAGSQDAAFLARIDVLLDAVEAEFSADRHKGQAAYIAEGPLAFFGYHVGRRSGLSASKRRGILSAIYRRSIPRVFPASYLAGWGAPGTPERLERMARAIAGFIRDPKRRNDPRMEDAIADWTEDLAYLRQAHFHREFSWPVV